MANRGATVGARARELFATFADMVVSWTLGEGVTFANPSALRMFGLTREAEALGRAVWDFVPPAEVPTLRAKLSTLSPGNNVHIAELAVAHASGERRWTRWATHAFFDERGLAREFVSVGHDITDRKQAEEALRASEARHRAVVSAVPDILFRIDEHDRFVDVFTTNPAQLALPPEQFIGKTLPEVFGAGIREIDESFVDVRTFARRLLEATARVRRTHKLSSFDYTVGGRDYEARLVWAGNGEVVAIARDITDAKTVETALRTSEERLSLAITASSQGLWDWDIVSDNAYLSPEYYALLGYRPGELPTDSTFFRRVVHPDDLDAVNETMRRHLAGETSLSLLEYRAIKKSGDYVWLRGIGRVTARDPNDVPLRMTGVVTDITEQKTREADLQSALRSREDVLAFVSHDLRTPLSAIRLSASLLAKAIHEHPQARGRRELDVILRSSEHMTNLIDDLVQAATIEAGTFSVMPAGEDAVALLHDVVQDLEPLAAAKSVHLEVQASRLPTIRCDRRRFMQVLTNLLGNAIKFTPPGGSIRISAQTSAREVRFTVADDGPGVPEAELPHVFERFRQVGARNGGGAGLGLFIARGIVEAHGGRIWAEKRPAGGAVFGFTFPLAAAEATAWSR